MYCYYHPKQPLTNFCNHPQCALPLCPKCINLHLSQSSVPHQILPLTDILDSVNESLALSQQALEHEFASLTIEYDPRHVLKDYKQMLDKYRRQSIDQINRHYDYLERQLLNEIGSRYSHNLQNILVPLQNQLEDIKKWNHNIKTNENNIETLIMITNQQSIYHIEDLLLKIKDKKLAFKSQLPRLQDGEAGKLKMTTQKVELYPQTQPVMNQTYQTYQNSAGPAPVQTPFSGIDRIANLQARLHSLRYD